MRVLVTGSRDWDDPFGIDMVLSGLRKLSHEVYDEDFVVIEGGARGADNFASVWGLNDVTVGHVTYPANWDADGKRAGPIRNRHMFDDAQPDFVVAFHDDLENSKGTLDMVNYASTQGVPIYHVRRID